MKIHLTLLLIFFCLMGGWAQEQRSPNVEVNGLTKGESPIRISDVKIDVKVVGALAMTTVDMTFYNPNNRILEGELQFPLADGQSISRFALDINGKLREGVVVEKAKGQEVFESTIRRKVDPGLLEKTVGNNFRTRVYPLPAKGTRRIVIAYEQELTKGGDNDYRFFLPVEYRDILDNFNLNIAVHTDGQKPVVEKTPWSSFSFDKSGEAYLASYSVKKYPAKGQLVFSIPIKSTKQVYIEKGRISNFPVFYAQVFPSLTEEAKQSPKNIAIFWDTSSSMSGRNLQLEMELLENYFKENPNLTVDLYVFNCVLGKSQTFTITKGNCTKLKEVLKGIQYDGATQLGILDFSKINVDEILLFTDGLSNFGKSQPVIGKSPVSVISSSLRANHSLLKYINISSGGAYINLMNQTPQDAAKIMKNESFRLISSDYNKSEISNLTTSGTIVDSKAGFTMAGKLKKSKATITLSFGIGSRILYTETLVIDEKNIADYDNIVERVWAEKKIAELDLLYDKNRNEIESLGREYNIVTRNTSLIVLDDIRDYVTHRIVPPTELLDEYTRIVDEQNRRDIKEKQDRIQAVLYMLEGRKRWWNRDIKKEIEASRKERNGYQTVRSRSGGSSMIARQTNSYNGNNVSGVIKDETGEVIIGATVRIKGANIATVSDIDGMYSINAKIGDVLEFMYVGMNSIEVTVRGSGLDIVLTDSQSTLDEVVVMGYGTQRRRDVTGSVSRIVEASEDAAEVLAGHIPGVQINSDSQNSKVTIRGTSSGSSRNESLKTQATTHTPTAAIVLNRWSPDAAYVNELKTESDKDLYASYLAIRDEYKSTPSFFLEVSTLFEERGLKEEALIILSNLAELEVENYRLTRVLAHRLKQMGYNEYAIDQFKELLTLRPEEPQTYRDLGLAYAQNKEYQQAVETLYKIIDRSWDSRFPQIELFAVEEINNAIDKAKREKVQLDLSSIDNRLIDNMPVNIRIVLNWDTDNSDMDLWVTDPNGEKCYYSHKQTQIGGLISDDFTGGYGPEEFLIKEAIEGKYKIQANYYGSREQTLIGPTTVYLDIYTYYSTGKEKKETITLRLSNKKETIDIGEITFK